MYLSLRPRDVYNFDETALFLSVLPRKTYGGSRVPGRKLAKERLTVGLLVNADASHAFRPLIISKSKRPRDFLPDYDPEELCYWRNNKKGWMNAALFTHFIGQLNAAMVAEDRQIAILLDNASSHVLKDDDATSEDLFGFRTRIVGNIRLVFLPPNTTAFTQPFDQGLIATTKARYRQHWLRAVTTLWQDDGAFPVMARYRPNMRDVIAWLSESWMNIPVRTIQRCWWRTGCMPRSWAMDLTHVGLDGLATAGNGVNAALPIDLDEDIGDIGIMIARLGLGSSAMPAAAFVAIDDDHPTCAEPGEDPLALEPPTGYSGASWEAPSNMQAVYDDDNPESHEARRYARAASEMLIGYARATGITPRNLCALFEIKNPVIVDRMERASPPMNLNTAPMPAPLHAAFPASTPTKAHATIEDAATARRRGRVLPAWMYAPAPTRQQLIDSGVSAVMNGYVDAAEWMTLMGLHSHIVVQEHELYGFQCRGLFAHSFIAHGEVVCDWDEGEIRGYHASDLSAEPDKEKRETMIRYAYMVGDDLYDTTADPEDDPSFYYNHSCDPNTWYANPRCMVALRDIQPGEHVTYDYACTETEGSMHAGLRCRCGAACCRGTLNFTEWRSHDWQRRFAGHCSAYIEQKMAESGWYDPRVVTRYKVRGADAFKGLFALASIRRGEPLLVFAGKLVGLDYLLGSDERVRELSLRVNDHLWQVPDPTRGPETPDFINHSCDPNCGLEDSVTVVALRNIAPGEELSIDYGSTNAGVVRTSSDNFSCHCGASICRGVVTCDDWRLPELRQRLWPFFPPFIKRLIVRKSEKSDLKRSESDESCESIEGDELAFTTKMKVLGSAAWV
ncbi:unnamed protein product [Closterium sp. NIES-64]|nr:unnamed protein product [Closterium sp. NIES-64]